MNNKEICTHVIPLLHSKNYSHTEKILTEFLDNNSAKPETLELMGLSLLLQNKDTQAKQYLSDANELEPNNPRYLCNLGEVLRKLGELDAAKKHLQSAIKLQKNYTSAQFNLACTLLAQKKYRKTLLLLKKLIQNNPKNSQYHSAIADLFRETYKTSKAIAHYNKAIELDPNFVAAHSNLGPLLISIGKIDEALIHCKKAVDLSPENGLAHLNLGRCLSELEQYDDAMHAFADALELIPDNAFLLSEIANNWSLVGDLIQAEHWFMQAIEKDEKNISALCGLTDTHREGNLLDEALDEINNIIKDFPETPQALNVRAKIHLDLGNIEECLDDYKSLIQLKPNQAAIYSAYGHALENAGEINLAENQFRLALKINPSCLSALNGLATTKRGRLPEEDVQKLHSLLDYKEFRDGAKASLHSGLGYYYDGIKDYKKAATHINYANKHYWLAKSKKGWRYDPDQYKRQVDVIIETFDKNYFTRASSVGHNSSVPSFILGMPRSGTTLTEQILNAHPNVLGIGERNFASESFSDLPNIFNQANISPIKLLPHLTRESIHQIANWYLAKLDNLEKKSSKSDVLRIVDKMPDNYSQIGWILTLFPKAKIIHAKRDVRDIAVSCWMTQFGKIRWAFKPEHLAERIIQYDRLMKYWRTTIPQRILETQYEDMIQEQEYNSKRIINFLDLPWDDACLSFHKQDTVVRTASVTQVRQPLYKKSLQRWKRYEKPLAELFERLIQANVDFYVSKR